MTAFFKSEDGNAYAIKEPYVGQVSVKDSERVWFAFIYYVSVNSVRICHNMFATSFHVYLSQACCSIFNNDGYSCCSEIVSIPIFDMVEVFYVGYGNSSPVLLASIR